MIKALLYRIVTFLRRLLCIDARIVLPVGVKLSNTDCEKSFITDDGRAIPIMPSHRYSLKDCWAIFGPLAALDELNKEGLLSAKTQKFLVHARGYRTLTESIATIREELAPYLRSHADRFISTEIPDIGRRLLRPSPHSVQAKIHQYAQSHRSMFNLLKEYTEKPPISGEGVLEIGYTSGGESIVAYETLGFSALGLDNFYYNTIQAPQRHRIVSEISKSKAKFLVGDITQVTPIENDSVALVYSQSVIEHIENIDAAFLEMFRILRPGGVIYHRFDPYFHILGAHSAGTLDSPWAHMLLSESEIDRYIRELRPHEADITIPWIRSALHREHTQISVQKAILAAGFQLRFLSASPMNSERMSFMTPDMALECLQRNENVSMSDLFSSAVTIIAEKPLR
jgi:SAM-dependent methyltransferase